MRMTLDVREEGDVHIVRVRGEVDLDTSPTLWTEIERALKAAHHVKVHLLEVSYMDSSGVATLIKGLKHAAKSDTKFSLLEPSPRVMAVLDLAQLGPLFVIERRETGA